METEEQKAAAIPTLTEDGASQAQPADILAAQRPVIIAAEPAVAATESDRSENATQPAISVSEPDRSRSAAEPATDPYTRRLPSSDHFGGNIAVPVTFYNEKREIFKKTESCVTASRTIFVLGMVAMAVAISQGNTGHKCFLEALIYMAICGSALLCPSKKWSELYGVTIVDENVPVSVPHKLQVYFNNVQQWGLLCQLQLVFTLVMAGGFYFWMADDPLAMIVAGLCAAVTTGWLFVLIHDRI